MLPRQDPLPPSPAVEVDPLNRGQVCDRCRRRKIRCHGSGDKCFPCATAETVCVRSTKLRRNRKRRSFYENQLVKEQGYAASMSPGAQAGHPSGLSRDSLHGFQSGESATLNSPSCDLTLHQTPPTTAGRSVLFSPNETPLAKNTPAAEPVIGHLGRLVHDDRGVAAFAGSTSGVHFVSQVEQQAQMLGMATQVPQFAYGLHLHDIWGVPSQAVSERDVIRSIMARLPPDTESIVSDTIDQWTPIYPVFHKTTTLEALRALGDHSPRTSEEGIITLHQVLGLLALGSVGRQGQCVKDHHHFLCMSEAYYALSTTILGKVLENPCLQALQALQVLQIYLQISARHTMASHFGGMATRLAQSLGLHRHSQRFLFNPLEAELRRRAWWCQYTLDTFSSAYHGLPRLIRDQDTDTDFPRRVDHELMSRDHVALPLPGEGSRVDPALRLFRLARVIGDALEDLYTTTRRRGGGAKIVRLQADLDAWARGLPGRAETVGEGIDARFHNGLGPSFREDEADTAPEPQPGGHFASLFLRVTHYIATIHIHRPALSFTNQDSQFTASLQLCNEASVALIETLSAAIEPQHTSSLPRAREETETGRSSATSLGGLLACLLYPCGAHMVWQAGLTILYARWKHHGASPDPGADPRSEAAVQRCTRVLRRLGALTAGTHGHDANRLGSCADVLDALGQRTFAVRPAGPGAGEGSDPRPQETASPWNGVWDQAPGNNIWDWPLESVAEFTNLMDTVPLDFFAVSPGSGPGP